MTKRSPCIIKNIALVIIEKQRDNKASSATPIDVI